MKRHGFSDTARAFITALKMTVRGEKPASLINEEANAPLLDWCKATIAQVKAIEEVASAENVPLSSITLHIEGRDMSLATALAGVRYHAAQEYPSLIRQAGGYARLAIQAGNLNDRYALMRFAQFELTPPGLREKLAALNDHLANMPPESMS